jgi:hypothetical protein
MNLIDTIIQYEMEKELVPAPEQKSLSYVKAADGTVTFFRAQHAHTGTIRDVRDEIKTLKARIAYLQAFIDEIEAAKAAAGGA